MYKLNGTRPLETYVIASGSTIACGNLVALNSDGKAVPASDATGLKVVGVAERAEDGKVEVIDGVIGFANDSSNALTRASRGGVCYVKDKDTVSSSAGSYGVVAGIVVDVYNGEVLVDLSPVALKVGNIKQAAAVADCTLAGDNATSAETQLNALLAALRTAGVLAPNA